MRKLVIYLIVALSCITISNAQTCYSGRQLPTNNDISVYTDMSGGIGIEVRTQDDIYVALSGERFEVQGKLYHTWGGSAGVAIHRQDGNFLIGLRLNNMHSEDQMRFMYGAEAEMNFNIPVSTMFIGFRTTFDRQLLNRDTFYEPSNVFRAYVKVGFRL